MTSKIDKDKGEILEELSIGSDLSLEFQRQASYHASWGFAHADAEHEARLAEERKEVIWARLQGKYRREVKAPKENEVKAWIIRHPAHRRAVLEWHMAKYRRDVLRVAMEAFRSRKDMLVQLGADKRAEYDATGMTMREKIDRANRVLRKTIRKRRREDG